MYLRKIQRHICVCIYNCAYINVYNSAVLEAAPTDSRKQRERISFQSLVYQVGSLIMAMVEYLYHRNQQTLQIGSFPPQKANY